MGYSNIIKYNYDQIYRLLKENPLPEDAINRTWFGIYRGGLPLAHMLSIIYNHKDFGVVYPKQGKIIYPNKSINKSALIIDDTIYRGRSLKVTKEILKTTFLFRDIKSFVFIKDENREAVPDFWVVDTIIGGDNNWIELPWDEYDDFTLK